MYDFSNFTSTLAFKLLLISGVIIVLLIPQSMIKNLIDERSETQKETVSEIQESWGGDQILYNVYLAVPYKDTSFNSIKGYINIMPEHTILDANAEVSERYFGIYKTPVYITDLQVNNIFNTHKAVNEITNYQYLAYDEAQLVINVSDQSGVRSIDKLSLNNSKRKVDILPSQNENEIRLKTPLNSLNKHNLAFSMQFKGSEMMSFSPYGKSTTVNFKGNWGDPGFAGTYLPDEREIGKDEFTANWSLPEFNHRFVETFDNTRPPMGEDFLGVEFVTPVNIYLQTERSIKYAFLIIILTFLIVFFSEIRLHLNLNAFAYLLVGLAVVMFYSLELSLTEHLSFDLSYGAACVLTLGIIIGFVYRLIKSIAFSLFMLFMLGIGYGFIYIILQMESYSLLVGTLGVFAILSIIMLITSSKSMRNILVKAQDKINVDSHSI